MVKVLCDCGVVKDVRLGDVKNGDCKSCGCIKYSDIGYDIAGMKFGEWTILEELMKLHRDRKVLVQCSCGNKTMLSLSHLKTGGSNSCGCLDAKRMSALSRTHGLSHHPLYATWCNIKGRCFNPKSTAYESYGGRGITMCLEWKTDFVAFYNWCMENGWQNHLTIDRENNDGNYEPSNCRWVTEYVQRRNHRANVWITYEGETKIVHDWAKEFNMKESTLYNRIRNGMQFEDAIKKEVKKNNFQANKLSQN